MKKGSNFITKLAFFTRLRSVYDFIYFYFSYFSNSKMTIAVLISLHTKFSVATTNGLDLYT